MSRTSLLVFAVPAAFAGVVATDAAQGAEPEPVVVTATRTARTADESLSAVTVIDREEIERSQATSLAELLRARPGVDLAVSGGPGKLTSLFTRGAPSDHTLLLVDGVRMGSVSSGGASWEFLPLSQIERVEIVRGPHSTLYGSEASAGVVQVFTRDGSGPPEVSVSATAGSNATREGSVAVTGGRTTRYAFSAGYRRSDGFDARQTVEPDDDGYDNSSASLRLSHGLGSMGSVEVHGLHASGNNEFDPLFAGGSNAEEYAQTAVGAELALRPLAHWRTRLIANASRDDRTQFREGVPGTRTRFDSERWTYSWQNDLTVGEGQLVTLGLDYQDDRLESTTAFAEESRYSRALFAQYQGRHGPVDLLLGLRRLENEQFGYHTVGNGALGIDLGRGLRWSLSYGTGFKAPTFNDLYFPGFSNPDLEPEESRSAETALTGSHGALDWELRAFRNDIDELIVFVDPDGFTGPVAGAPQNVDEARITGGEAIVGVSTGAWRGELAITVLDAEDRSTGNRLPRRAEESARLDLDRRVGRGHVGISVVAQGERYDDPANTTELPGYTLVDLRAGYRLGGGWSLRARADNVLDRDYRTVATFNARDRSFFMTLAWQSEAPAGP